MRRALGVVVVMGMIGAWNVAGRWWLRPENAARVPSALVSSAAPAPTPAPPAAVVARTGNPPRPQPPASFRRDPLVFLSTASAESLDLLPGVGPVLAARIIDARTARGAFHSWNDVLAIRGIGPRTVERWQSSVSGQ